MRFNHLSEIIVFVESNDLSEKAAVSKLTISQETCHMCFFDSTSEGSKAEGDKNEIYF